MRDCSTLCDLAQAEMDALHAYGIALTPAEVVKINWLAWQVATPEHRMLSARGMPVHVGGVWLWPLTVRAAEWFREFGLKMPSSVHERALAYAMAHGRSDGTELDQQGRDAEKAVTGWAKGLRCTFRELTEALAQIISQSESDELPPEKESDGENMSVADMSSFLCAAAGGTPELWERQVSSDYIMAMFRAILRQNAADDRPVAGDLRIMSTKALGWACIQIRESRREPTQPELVPCQN